MGRFDRSLKHLSIDEKTIEVEFTEMHQFTKQWCKEPPVLLLAHMGRANRAWWNARVSATFAHLADEAEEVENAKNRPDLVKRFEENAAKEAESMERNRETMPEHIVKGWRHMYNDDGVEEPFSVEAARDLLTATNEKGAYVVPDDILLKWMGRAADVSLFRTAATPTAADAEVLAKNSSSD